LAPHKPKHPIRMKVHREFRSSARTGKKERWGFKSGGGNAATNRANAEREGKLDAKLGNKG